MNTSVKADGIFRPEQWMDGRWQAVAYHPLKKGLSREPHGENKRGSFFPFYYESQAEAQIVSDQLNM